MASQLQERGETVWFLTEQACCLKTENGKETDHFLACRQAVEFLARNDQEAVGEFFAKTDAIVCDPDNLADYDAEEYDSREADLLKAAFELLVYGNDPAVPKDIQTALLKSAETIVSFYGTDVPPITPLLES